MPETIAAGKILVREGTEFPRAVRPQSEPYAAGWRLVDNLDGYQLGRQIQDAGWTFFCQAGGLKAMAFGMDEQKTVRRAVERILAQVKSEEFNSLEITRIVHRRLLGVLPYASVSARSRHVQESVFLFQAVELPVTDAARRAAA
jgi:hypothetical protein